MDICYCVFWFPTIFHREKCRRIDSDKFPVVSISDGDLIKNLDLRIEEKEVVHANPNEDKKYDLVFYLTDNDGKEINIKFSCKDQSRNGFVVYSYDRDELIEKYWRQIVVKEQDPGKIDSVEQEIINELRPKIVKRIASKHTLVGDSIPDEKQIKDYTVDRLLISFYHHAKLFYHEHETHNDSDGRYSSYYYSKEYDDGKRDYLKNIPSLLSKNNPVINWYIDQFEKRIVEDAETISKHYREWSDLFDLGILFDSTFINEDSLNRLKREDVIDRINLFRVNTGLQPLEDSGQSVDDLRETLYTLSRKNAMTVISNQYEWLEMLSNECHNSLIEYTYCKALLGSKYNDDYDHNSIFTSADLRKPFSPELEEKDSRRKKAFNIRNSIRYIEDIKQKCDFGKSKITRSLISINLDISQHHEDILGKIEALTNDNKKILDNVDGLTVANNKNNGTNSFLAWVALGIAALGLIGIYPDSNVWKIICLVGFVFCIVYGSYLKISQDKSSSSQEKSK